MNRVVDVLVIGAGQAGLAVGYYLRQRGLSCLLLDAAERLGDSWRKRYDSLVLFTPRAYSSLPGFPFPGEPDGLPGKDEVADYLEAYADRFQLPVQMGTAVQRVERVGERFRVITDNGNVEARCVVVATGAFQQPKIPADVRSSQDQVRHLHSAHYRSAQDLQPGSVLVAGGGNTGVQLAIELSHDRPVYLAQGERRTFLPLFLFNKNIFWWFEKLGLLDAHIESWLGKWLSRKNDPVFGWKAQLKQQVRLGRLTLKPKVSLLEGQSVRFADGSTAEVQNVVWCTGYKSDYHWIEIPGVVDGQGQVMHRRGVSQVPGLYFIGLPWQYRRGSALIGGVGRDAAYLTERIAHEINSMQDERQRGAER
ncbi:NAD(P)/FAD-dependent oxidoreductase [Brevibacillus humidisoli]|uniref:flavin-containing monooxygenase n=1 Tax=Brevibacillus humidisoli TaxID=2895522 RepID=UPI001E29AE70|nr:NAD(P)/FAD-dependent oxidoreductase [Brevibacillus humidisoli]UFJ39534.1 NAD(P)/FAD-dependent oxidoreductase [Brevibacillus humidisoli]